jgi:hypothetical protein
MFIQLENISYAFKIKGKECARAITINKHVSLISLTYKYKKASRIILKYIKE